MPPLSVTYALVCWAVVTYASCMVRVWARALVSAHITVSETPPSNVAAAGAKLQRTAGARALHPELNWLILIEKTFTGRHVVHPPTPAAPTHHVRSRCGAVQPLN